MHILHKNVQFVSIILTNLKNDVKKKYFKSIKISEEKNGKEVSSDAD